MPDEKNNTPGTPGIKAKWTWSSKSGKSKVLNTDSLFAFNISHGILNEDYFPGEYIKCIRDLNAEFGLLVFQFVAFGSLLFGSWIVLYRGFPDRNYISILCN